ncbi:4-hydroxy-3-methylbut-2-enyl diphosphate reductase [Peptostreptococcus anaerobius]|uniref:4-hydroxy-3-methylbut-2-enyl diphosphate reductase n=1 Tax=Peptostreptococcus anaerobius TaxID=1261 RepID=UPI0028FF6806|nr:4-hydroxy-3-methylbut-2-enyl diphosphate reductase [Peptostreptococcus anaerobius]MDU0964089.1 4-hydroxy-3-methylbut-2-enyl diphosphate reductase [Peptostreptococcus anaerobius]MDU0997754.1 4-hydroxy-3-methylbut-2-enyl diphosphate reductase [Peptostreptococcus anaerobius]
MKKILIADDAGFCFGVKRAMNIAWNEVTSTENEKIYALGPLIHNKQAVAKYEEKGLVTVDEIGQIEDQSSKMIIRSHGVAKKIYDEAENHGLEVVDTTCPFVKKIHTLANKAYNEGKQVIILGDASHPEIIGINGWCQNSAIIFKTLEQFKEIDLDKSKEYLVVSQTTMNEKEFEKIVEYIEKLDMNINIENTICSATRVRQNSARKIASQVDAMVVIGGRHSSNTQKLVKICSESVDTYAVETKKELEGVSFDTYEIIGVTAGASTPDWIIEEVIDYLSSL